ncbi:MAG: hypothetical protein PUB20_03240 [Clostridia bacterium]|nr:hypothetical protein [Clostridia bacterium]
MKKKVIIIIIAVAVLCAAALAVAVFLNDGENENNTDSGVAASQQDFDLPYALPNGCVITEIKSYNGPFVEDGSGEEKTNVTAIVIKNDTGKNFQYIDFNLKFEGADKDYNFKITTLFDNSSMTVLESNAADFISDKITHADISQSIEFASQPTVHPQELEISVGDGMMNVKNISGEDINGNIYVYYKIADGDDWFGGITYRSAVSGLKNGELKQISTSHFKSETCKVVFTEYDK